MRDPLEDFIRDNREAFNETSMPEGHEDRFLMKLNASTSALEKPVRRLNSKITRIAAAAVVILGFGAGMFYLGQQDQLDSSGSEQLASMRLADVNPEMAEVETFFTKQIESQRSRVAEMNGNEEVTAAFLAELDALELQYTDLEKELALQPNNDQIVQAMIRNYKLRIDVLEKLMNQIQREQFKLENQQRHEKQA